MFAIYFIQPDVAFHRTPVTKETFVAWKKQFDAEMVVDGSRGNKEARLTGMYLPCLFNNVTMSRY